jgi:hypothetical protein
MLRIQLLNDQLGSLIIEKDDPIGINSMTQTIKRSAENDGVVFEIIFDLEFIKEARRYLKLAYENAGGVDAVVNVNVYEYDPNLRTWELYATGQVNFSSYDLGEDTLKVAIEQTGFQRAVLNQLETDVDLESTESENGTAMNPVTFHSIPYHSKVILKEFEGTPQTNSEFSQPDAIFIELGTCAIGPCERSRDVTVYGNIEVARVIKDELTETFKNVWGFGPVKNPVYVAREAGTASISISTRLKMSIFASQSGGSTDVDIVSPCSNSGILANRTVNLYFEHHDSSGNVKTINNFGTMSSVNGCGGDQDVGSFETHTYSDDNVTIEVGDRIYVYMTVRINGTYELSGGTTTPIFIGHEITVEPDIDNTFVRISNNTISPEVNVKTALVHDVAKKICQTYTNQAECFVSDLLGRTNIGYSSNGKYALLGLTNGEFLRGRNDKRMFVSMKSLLDLLNNIACVGFGFESVSGRQVLRIEPKSYFYNKSLKILSLGKVYNIRKKVDNKKYFNQIEIGYLGNIDIKSINGIDEFNTIRRFKIPVNAKNKLSVATNWKAGGYQIESQKRLFGSTEDSNLDSENFVVCLRQSGGSYIPKKNEDYTSITNVINSDTGYNYDISPARILREWFGFIASMLIRSNNKTLKFTYGNVNYTMTTKKTGETFVVQENGDVVCSVKPIYDPEVYYFESPLSRNQFRLIKESPYGYIEFEDQFGELMSGFIHEEGIEHDSNKGIASFNLLKRVV